MAAFLVGSLEPYSSSLILRIQHRLCHALGIEERQSAVWEFVLKVIGYYPLAPLLMTWMGETSAT